jgi:predicted nuclease of restriction endonuclease-like (RecB) superfamily
MTQESGSSQNGYKSEYFEQLIINIPYSHFIELIKIDDSIKRSFYELLILKTVPSVRELRRQIETLSYERLGLSADKETTWFSMQDKLKPVSGNDLVKSHYFFEFLNINNPELIEESELELGLISHLQEFIIELGNGFCFEARQKRILIGDEYFFIDLVFYHRILKCHVLIELKTEWVKHEHIGQLKVYLQHYKRTMRAPDDNPPVGILLVTGKNKTLVEYAVADADKEIFVSRYQLQLPDKKELERFIREEMRKL